MSREILMGTGVLTWHRMERVSDRYGTVHLIADGETSMTNGGGSIPLTKSPNDGTNGALIVEIVESRESTHIGDLFHGIGPRKTPNGARLVLGSGELFREHLYECDSIGVKPALEKCPWMDMRALYDCHEHLVRLIFIPKI